MRIPIPIISVNAPNRFPQDREIGGGVVTSQFVSSVTPPPPPTHTHPIESASHDIAEVDDRNQYPNIKYIF